MIVILKNKSSSIFVVDERIVLLLLYHKSCLTVSPVSNPGQKGQILQVLIFFKGRLKPEISAGSKTKSGICRPVLGCILVDHKKDFILNCLIFGKKCFVVLSPSAYDIIILITTVWPYWVGIISRLRQFVIIHDIMTILMIMMSYLRTAPEVKTVERLSCKLSVPEHQVYLEPGLSVSFPSTRGTS